MLITSSIKGSKDCQRMRSWCVTTLVGKQMSLAEVLPNCVERGQCFSCDLCLNGFEYLAVRGDFRRVFVLLIQLFLSVFVLDF